ncbi:TonB-dependent receptor plug domain-containing protein [Ferrimonas marina]|uniref:Outer membrane receptor for ferrienterochelin and colicins n=1 Tax=Ferrimonas marina TaxID=299255 RepID=A0A1M5MT80_9GAMM|nr:TonB-dependent receptor [Ferrimonas marina]SHG80395.1 outer membrane receptor for ferrienterochelin and colicins [Ferrimonas marina]
MKKCSISLAVAAGLYLPAALADNAEQNLADADHEVLVVTASTRAQSVALAPATVAVIDRELIESVPYRDLTDVLDNIAGVQVEDVGQGKKGVSIRGLDTTQTLVLLDGERMSGADTLIGHANFDMQGISPNQIERIEVIKGPLSALYGSDALGGVVNIITKPASNEWGGMLTVTGGAEAHSGSGNGSVQVNAGGALIPDRLLLDVGVSYMYNDDVASRLDERESDLAGNESLTAHARLAYHVNDEHTLSLRLEGTQQEVWYDIIDKQSDLSDRSTDQVDTFRVSAAHHGDFAWGGTELRVYHTQFSQENTRSLPDSEINDPNDIDETMVEGNVQMDRDLFGMDHSLVFGGSFFHQTLVNPAVNAEGEASTSQGAVFFQDDIALTHNLNLLLGARVDHHDEFGTHTTPRAYLVYQPSASWVIKGGYGEGFKAPSLKQLSDDYLSNPMNRPFDLIGNSDLKPEENAAYELSAHYLGERWNMEVTGFYNDVTNLIGIVCIEDCPVPGERPGRWTSQYFNIDSARLQGVEANLSADLTRDLVLDMNATFLDAKDLDADELIEGKARWRAGASLRWDLNDALSLAPRVRYIGEQMKEGQTLPGYTLVDLNASWHVREDLRLNIGGANLTDVYLPEKSALFNHVEPGRRFYINASWEF